MVKQEDNLTPEQRHVLEDKGTEAPFTGKLLHNKENGVYSCVACGSELFKSDHKFDSGSGWPSFSDAMNNKNVTLTSDDSLGMHRTEVTCSKCGGHLGHLFNDGPTDSGQRYCINSVTLDFNPSKKAD